MIQQQGETTMTRLGILGVTLALALLPCDCLAQALRGGMRGAVVGGMFGGSGGAATGAKIGVVTGATRAAIGRESQARTQYQNTAQYQNGTFSNYNQAPPEILGTTPTGDAKKTDKESVIRKDDKPLLGVTFPADWNVKTGDNYISAVSPDGHAYSMFVAAAGIADKQSGVKKVKDGLGKYLEDIKFDEPSETKGGATVITGTGKGKKAGIDAVFAVGVFEAAEGQFVGAAFVVDAKIDEHYKETVRGICETIRRAKDFTD
jgi:hypothetical protein